MIGTTLKNRYLVQEKIGEENLFSVYKCQDTINDRIVAVKVLASQYALNRMFAERILVEAQAMVGISHPGIVEVYDCGEENGQYFVVVEHIRGLDLKERIRRGAPFTLSTAVDVCIAISDVLDYTHKRGFVHGDLRPGNIMVTPEGQLKIADFWAGGAVASQQSVRASTLMSSIHYMSPEVAEGKLSTPASDIYSLGVILFELLTASVPFDGDTPVAIALKHARDPIPAMRPLNPNVPKMLEAVVVRAMQKEPEDRFRSAKSMLNELKSCRDALRLTKPVVWSETTDASEAEPALEPEDRRYMAAQREPVFLVALRRVLVIVCILLVITIAAAAYMLMKTPPEVKIPDLVGQKLEDAQNIANRDKFELVKQSEQYNEKYPADVIYYMSPSPGRTIKAGKTVEVWISKGSKYANAPNLINLALEDARQRVVDAGLNVGEVSQDYNPTVPAGDVISQTPDPGTRLERGQDVNLDYSLGPNPTEVPATSPDGASASTSSDNSSTDNTPDYGNTQNSSDNSSAQTTSTDNSAADTSNNDSTTSAPKTRTFTVKLTVPPGDQDQLVEIRVLDDNGEGVAYSEIKHPGDRIKQTVQGVGKKVTIQIYIDNKLVQEERK